MWWAAARRRRLTDGRAGVCVCIGGGGAGPRAGGQCRAAGLRGAGATGPGCAVLNWMNACGDACQPFACSPGPQAKKSSKGRHGAGPGCLLERSPARVGHPSAAGPVQARQGRAAGHGSGAAVLPLHYIRPDASGACAHDIKSAVKVLTPCWPVGPVCWACPAPYCTLVPVDTVQGWGGTT